jgi:hypothetical protein
MLKITMPIVGLMLLGVHPSAASDCDTNGPLTASQIRTLLSPGSEIYACGRSGTEKWNETLKNNTDVWDYKLGNAPADPSTRVARYSIIGRDVGAGRIVYEYGGGARFTYEIAPTRPGTFPNMGQYFFCQNGGPTYTINVTLGPGTC